MSNGLVLFFGGFMSQWYPCTFRLHGVSYNCAEQCMMAQKALYFDDPVAHRRIMQADLPSEQKMIGRLVKKFDAKQWAKVSYRIVLMGNLAKFTQNARLRELLLLTEGNTIAEASPIDRIWGIGLGVDDPRALDPQNWPGENLLGKVLMEVRDEFQWPVNEVKRMLQK